MSYPVKIAASILTAVTLLFAGLSMALADHIGGNEFIIMVDANINDDSASKLQDPRRVGNFKYLRELSTPTLDASAGWLDGDRSGYRCAYAFLQYRGFIVGRATYAYIDPPGDGNTPKINDKYMHEGELNHDGSPVSPENASIDQADVTCPGGATSEHTPPPPGAQAPTTVTFQHGPHAIEVRDFADTDDVSDGAGGPVCCGHTFQVAAATENRVEIIGFQDGVPVLQVLYELIGGGQIVPGTLHPVTLHVGCGLGCGGHEPDHGPPPSPEPSPEPSTEPSTEPSPPPSPEPSTEPVPGPDPIPGDINGDGRVDFADLSILVDNWTG